MIIKPQTITALGMIMAAVCPGGNISHFMTHLVKGNSVLSVSLTAFAIFLPLFMTPFNFELYDNLYEPTTKLSKEVALNPYD